MIKLRAGQISLACTLAAETASAYLGQVAGSALFVRRYIPVALSKS